MKKRITWLLMCTLLFASIWALPVMARDVTVNGETMTVDEEFDESEIPEGFYSTNLRLEEEIYRGIANEEDTAYMFYLRSATNPSLDGFYLYLGQGEFESGATAVGQTQSLTIEEPGEDVTLPMGYTKSSLKINGMNATVFKPELDDGAGNVLVYGTTDGTEHSWYLYNPEMGGYVRAVVDNSRLTYSQELEQQVSDLQAEVDSLNKKYDNDIGKTKNLFLAMIVLSTLFFFLMLNAMLKRRHIRMNLEDRILDLKRNGGQDTLKLTKREKRKQDRADAKAMARNHLTKEDMVGSAASVAHQRALEQGVTPSKEERKKRAKKTPRRRTTDQPRPKAQEIRPRNTRPTSELPGRASEIASIDMKQLTAPMDAATQEEMAKKVELERQRREAEDMDLVALEETIERMENPEPDANPLESSAESTDNTDRGDFDDDFDIRTIDLDDDF